ncbi:MAG: hypothetical protein M3O15_03380 [Acidobacteriota bacterium]|nr:hypothetical protein [Acidobacteriota bacterium]
MSGGPKVPPSWPRPVTGLETYSEATRRALYDVVVAVHFSSAEEPAEGGEERRFNRTPDEAGLAVHYWLGRWLVTWEVIGEGRRSELPLFRRWEVLRVTENPGAPYGVEFYEV